MSVRVDPRTRAHRLRAIRPGAPDAPGATGASSSSRMRKLRITGEVRRMAPASSWLGSGSCGRPRPPRRLGPGVGCPKYQPRAGSKRSQPRLDGRTGAQSHLPQEPINAVAERVRLRASDRSWQWGEIQLIKISYLQTTFRH
jgi:hypothetical protein